MSSSRAPARATDEESAPLLQQNHEQDHEDRSFFTRISTATQEPLSFLSKVLLGVILLLLILASVFIGLFAGVQHRLSSIEKGGDGEAVTTTETRITTTISTTTVTSTAPPSEPTTPPEEKKCTDPDCIVLAASILSSLDTTRDPCDDFYGFANGGWQKEHPVPADKGRYGHFDEVAVRNRMVIRQILEQNTTSVPSPDSHSLAKLQNMYASCMDEKHLNSLGIQPLADIVKTVRNLFNESTTVVGVRHDDQQQTFKVSSHRGLTAAISFLHSRGIDALFGFLVEGDVGVDPNAMTLWFYQPGFGLPSKEYFEEKDIVDKYTSTLEKFFAALEDEPEGGVKYWPPFPWPPWGGDDDDNKKPKPKSPSELANAVVEFEKKIAAATLDLDRLQQDPFGTYNPVSTQNISDSIPQIDFPTYWSSFTPRKFPDRVIVTYPPYMRSLSSLLSNTSDDVIEGYLVARVTQSLAEYLGQETEIWKANRELVELLTGIKKGAVGDRSEYCATQVTNALGFASGRFFVQEVFGGESRSKARRVIEDIVDAFKRSLSGIDWMDDTSAKAAAEKATNIRIKVGFPLSPNTSDATAIARYYSRLSVDKSDFLGNIQRATTFETFLEWQQLGKQRDKETWEMVPSEVNAYFNPPANEIVFPAGILQDPYFSKDWPGYLNYGAFGAVAAHELTHAFDSAGRLYDQNGKLREWWTNATSEAFEERRQCLSKQYSNYTVDDGQGGRIHVNGNLTSGENIGDQGLIQAYRAWQVQYDSSFNDGNEYLLPGLNFTREQLFFVSFARVWGSNIRPQAAVQQVRTDPHSPAQFRVLGTLVNIPAFAQAFNCPVGSTMNPPEKETCRLW